jgi:hypothetical protein
MIKSDTSASLKPNALEKVGAIEILQGWDNIVYTGTTKGTKAELLHSQSIADSANWEGSSSVNVSCILAGRS